MRAKKSILIVDSDPAVCVRLRSMLAAQGYTVAQASSLAEGLAALTELAWTFVVVGYQLSDGSGLELVRVAQERAPAVAIILTGDRRQATALAALRGGAADYLPAPVHEAELTAALARAAHIVDQRLMARLGRTPPARVDSEPPVSQATQLCVAALVHEISNPLTPIIGMAELLLEDLPVGHPGRDYATAIKAAAWRIRDVVRRLRATPESRCEDGLMEV
jgi:ActR/RegA family two-component response regulator